MSRRIESRPNYKLYIVRRVDGHILFMCIAVQCGVASRHESSLHRRPRYRSDVTIVDIFSF